MFTPKGNHWSLWPNSHCKAESKLNTALCMTIVIFLSERSLLNIPDIIVRLIPSIWKYVVGVNVLRNFQDGLFNYEFISRDVFNLWTPSNCDSLLQPPVKLMLLGLSRHCVLRVYVLLLFYSNYHCFVHAVAKTNNDRAVLFYSFYTKLLPVCLQRYKGMHDAHVCAEKHKNRQLLKRIFSSIYSSVLSEPQSVSTVEMRLMSLPC